MELNMDLNNYTMSSDYLQANTHLNSTQKAFINYIIKWQLRGMTCYESNKILAMKFGLKIDGIKTVIKALNKYDFFFSKKTLLENKDESFKTGHTIVIDIEKLIDFLLLTNNKAIKIDSNDFLYYCLNKVSNKNPKQLLKTGDTKSNITTSINKTNQPTIEETIPQAAEQISQVEKPVNEPVIIEENTPQVEVDNINIRIKKGLINVDKTIQPKINQETKTKDNTLTPENVIELLNIKQNKAEMIVDCIFYIHKKNKLNDEVIAEIHKYNDMDIDDFFDKYKEVQKIKITNTTKY
jgi:hypothetical protein